MTDNVNGNYNVKKGDTLYNITKKQLIKNGNSKPTNAQIKEAMKELAEKNNIKDVNKIKVGQKLDISGFKEIDDSTLIDYIDKSKFKPINITYALGENGTDTSLTTMALGEEGGTDKGLTTMALGEEGGSSDKSITTQALGEEGGETISETDRQELLKQIKTAQKDLDKLKLEEKITTMPANEEGNS